MGSPAELIPLVPAIGRGRCACTPTAEGTGWYCLPARKGSGQRRAVNDGMSVAVVETAAAAIAAAAAPFEKTAMARITTMLPAATAVQMG